MFSIQNSIRNPIFLGVDGGGDYSGGGGRTSSIQYFWKPFSDSCSASKTLLGNQFSGQTEHFFLGWMVVELIQEGEEEKVEKDFIITLVLINIFGNQFQIRVQHPKLYLETNFQDKRSIFSWGGWGGR